MCDYVQRLRGECCNSFLCLKCIMKSLCVKISFCLFCPSNSLTPGNESCLRLWSLLALSFTIKSALPLPWLQGSSFTFLPPPSLNKPFFSAAPMSCPAYRVGSVESVLTPESFGKPSRKLSVWGVTSGGEEETWRERKGGGEVLKALRGWLSNLFFRELSWQCVLSSALASCCQLLSDLKCLLSFFIYLISPFNSLPHILLYCSLLDKCGKKLGWSGHLDHVNKTK